MSDTKDLLLRARDLANAGLGRDADALFERYLALHPGHRFLAEGAERHRAGDLDGAVGHYRQALAIDPDNVDALRLLAIAGASLGWGKEAVTQARRATVLAPDFAAAWTSLGAVLSDLDEAEAAVEAFRRAHELSPESAEACANLGNALFVFGDLQGAETAYRQALELRPADPSSLLGLGHVLKTIGQQPAAIAAYRAALQVNPLGGEVWWSLANLKTYRFSSDDEDAMRATLASDSASEPARVAAAFALGKSHEDHGRHDEAFAAYLDGNTRQRTRVRYDPVQTEKINDRIVATFQPALFDAHAEHGHRDPAPIFIVGLPRSGSTLIEQILASHSQVDGTSELPALGRIAMEIGRFRSDGVVYPEAVRDLEAADLRALGKAYLARAQRHRGRRPRFTDKMPNNFASIGLLALILPEARIIDARRHPMDSCMGAFKQLFARGQTFTYDLFELGEYYLQYDRLMTWWNEVLPGRVLRVDYEALVMNQETETRRLLNHCGLAWEDQCLAFHETKRAVNTASSEQVRQPLYTGALGAWRRYASHLQDLERQLEPVIDALPAPVRDAGL